MPILVNLIGFFWCWLALVLGAFYDLVLPALGLLVCWTALHLFYSRTRAADLRLIGLACLIGPLVDTILLAGHWIGYAAHHPDSVLAPLWLFGCWANFALTLNHSTAWLRGRLWAAALFGAVSGPLSYLAGAALGAIELASPVWVPLLILCLSWAVVIPVLAACSVRRPLSTRVSGRTAS